MHFGSFSCLHARVCFVEFVVPNLQMLENLQSLFVPGLPSNEQTACIEYFLGNENFWCDFDFQTDEADSRIHEMIEHLLTLNPTGDVLEMLTAWLNGGF